MTALLETCRGLWTLAAMLARTGGRRTGPYWDWRAETAFGLTGPGRPSPTLNEMLSLARWMGRTPSLGSK